MIKHIDGDKEGKLENVVCSIDTCSYHVFTESIINDLKDVTKKLTEGQEQMRISITRLVEGFKYMEKLDTKVDKLEVEMRDMDAVQEIKIQELKSFIRKASGIAIGIVTTVGILVQVLAI